MPVIHVEPSRIDRYCRECGEAFEISTDEQEFFRRLAEQRGDTDWQLPYRCTACRADRRRARLAVIDDGLDEWIDCVDCGTPFLFGVRDKQYYAHRGFVRPRRCRFCRSAARR